jgi:hypothetical protein
MYNVHTLNQRDNFTFEPTWQDCLNKLSRKLDLFAEPIGVVCLNYDFVIAYIAIFHHYTSNLMAMESFVVLHEFLLQVIVNFDVHWISMNADWLT